MEINAQFNFFGNLNDFLSPGDQFKKINISLDGTPGIKDTIESFGIPHTEVDCILVNGDPVMFSYRLQDQDQVLVYPVRMCPDISEMHLLSTPPEIKFILDVHLGKLARKLRLLGFDSLYKNDYSDEQIMYIAHSQKRIILTRDIGILKHKKVEFGYWVHSTDPDIQIGEIILRFDLCDKIKPFTRCISCNGILSGIPKLVIRDKLKARTREYYHRFSQCSICGKIFWEGSHYEKLKKVIASVCQHGI